MKYINTFLCLFLLNCSNNKNNLLIKTHSTSDIYNYAIQKIKEGHLKTATYELEKLYNLYPIGSELQKIQLALIYVYYKSNNFILAKNQIDHFLLYNLNHPNTDYVLYISGLINLSLDENILHSILDLDNDSRNSKYIYEAFNNFVKLVQFYPDSKYYINSIKFLICLKHKLAKYELSVIKYYYKHGAYISVINRVEQMLKYFPNMEPTYQALFYMEKSYRKLKLYDQSNKVMEIININSFNFISQNKNNF